MSMKLYEESYISNIASRIRAKNGLSTTYTVSEMAAAVSAIQTQGTYQSKTVSPSTTSVTVIPDNGYDALSQVVVNSAPLSIPATINPSTAFQTIYTPTGYYGISRINVNGATLSSSTVTPTTTQQTITTPTGYYGLSTVTVNAIPSSYIIPTGTSNITSNGVYDITSYAAVSVDVTGGGGNPYADLMLNVLRRTSNFTESYLATVDFSGFLTSVTYGLGGSIPIAEFASCVFDGSIYFSGIGYIGSSAFTAVPAYLDKNAHFYFPDVGTIYTSAFYNNSNVIFLSAPQATGIYAGAFQSCSRLQSVYLNQNSNSTTNIGETVFMNCGQLKTFSAFNVKYVGSSAFQGCRLLDTNYNTFSAASFISDYAFRGCSTIKSMNLASTQRIQSWAFANCYSISYISIPIASYVSEWAFYNCSSLASINLPSCKTVGSSRFYSCSSLSFVSFGSDAIISSYAFAGCPLLSVVSARSVKTLGTGAFQSTRLKIANFPNVTTINGTGIFTGCPLEEVYFSSFTGTLASQTLWTATAKPSATLKKLEISASGTLNHAVFSNCSLLSQVAIPNIGIIGSSAFYGCNSLETIGLLPKVSSIYNNAFVGCTKLSALYLLSTAKVSLQASRAFNSTPFVNSTYLGYYGSIYVTESLVSTYKADMFWSWFADRITAYVE